MDRTAHAAPIAPRRRLRRRRGLWIAGLLLAASALVLAFWNTATVRPPAAPEEPVSVFLIRDALHRGLLFPQPGAGHVEFGFGEWRWYALGQDQWYRAFPTVLWPTPGTLSRRTIAARDAAGLRATLHWATFQELRVARAAVERLRDTLEREFHARRVQAISRPEYDMTFVPWPREYWMFHNCCDALAAWLRELGCAVSWVPVTMELEVVPASGSGR
ncbi:MAG: DUF2459 domain-containing protein [Planctomycetes bacterium]|nr:DUF2459 domain-containing protein [Planctomycetota bacterium]